MLIKNDSIKRKEQKEKREKQQEITQKRAENWETVIVLVSRTAKWKNSYYLYRNFYYNYFPMVKAAVNIQGVYRQFRKRKAFLKLRRLMPFFLTGLRMSLKTKCGEKISQFFYGFNNLSLVNHCFIQYIYKSKNMNKYSQNHRELLL